MLRRALSPHPLRFLLCLLLLPALMHLPGATAQDDDQRHEGQKRARREISALEDQWKAATLAGDATAMDKLLSDDYVGISWTGQVNTKTMQLDRTRSKGVVISKMDVSDVKVKLIGPVAIVTSRAEVQGSNDGRPIDGEFRYTRIYQRRPSGIWQITNFESTRIPLGGPHGRRPPLPPPRTAEP